MDVCVVLIMIWIKDLNNNVKLKLFYQLVFLLLILFSINSFSQEDLSLQIKCYLIFPINESIPSCTEIIKSEPENVKAHYSRGVAKYDSKDYFGAIR